MVLLQKCVMEDVPWEGGLLCRNAYLLFGKFMSSRWTIL